tara:strand:+ start:156 stop:443 length:288 start_codon:yes stop_codon:yes gene_type:complete
MSVLDRINFRDWGLGSERKRRYFLICSIISIIEIIIGSIYNREDWGVILLFSGIVPLVLFFNYIVVCGAISKFREAKKLKTESRKPKINDNDYLR